MESKPLTYEEFTNIYSKVPRVNVEVILLTEGGVVLTKRSIEPCLGQWHIPGGTIYMDEAPEDTVIRVAEEELGVQVEVIRLVGAITYPDIRKQGYFGWPVGLAYEVKLISGELRGSYQGEEVGTFEKLPDNMIKDQVKFIKNFYPKLI